MSLTLKMICVVLLIGGLGMFMRAYHLGNQSMGKIGKSLKERD
jgi:hypothetical protein